MTGMTGSNCCTISPAVIRSARLDRLNAGGDTLQLELPHGAFWLRGLPDARFFSDAFVSQAP